MREFVEKPGPEQIDTNLVNAGAYIIEREVLDAMPPAGTHISIEREVFPALVGRGLFGYEASGYWLDIGTPERYLQGTFDILEGNVSDRDRASSSTAAGLALIDGAQIDGRVVAPALRRRRTASSRRRAIVGGRDRARPRRRRSPTGAHVESSVLLDGASVGARSTVRSLDRRTGRHDRRPTATSAAASCSATASGSGRTTSSPPACVSSRAWSCPTERSSFDPGR